MYLKSRLMYLYVETPLHAGAGSGLGAVDLPIQRERATGYPIVQASGLKGALREMAQGTPDEITAIFGPDTDHADEHAGALAPGDARILLFPVRSLKGVFVWATSLNVLQRWQREVESAGLEVPALPTVAPGPTTDGAVTCWTSSAEPVTSDGYVVLEEFAFKRLEDPQGVVANLATRMAQSILPYPVNSYWFKRLATHLVILPDDDFRDFLLHATEVLTRVRLEPDTKTVARGALWTEEHLPADSVLYAPVRATRLRMPKATAPQAWRDQTPEAQAASVLTWISQKVSKRLQLGGDETVGRGIVHLHWSEVQHA